MSSEEMLFFWIRARGWVCMKAFKFSKYYLLDSQSFQYVSKFISNLLWILNYQKQTYCVLIDTENRWTMKFDEQRSGRYSSDSGEFGLEFFDPWSEGAVQEFSAGVDLQSSQNGGIHFVCELESDIGLVLFNGLNNFFFFTFAQLFCWNDSYVFFFVQDFAIGDEGFDNFLQIAQSNFWMIVTCQLQPRSQGSCWLFDGIVVGQMMRWLLFADFFW